MFRRSLGIAAICSVAVHALLLPPGTDNNDLFNPLVNPKARSIQLPCSSCAFPSGDNDEDLGSEGQIWLHSSYQLNLAFDVSSNGQRLELNNEAIYPDQFLRDAYIQGRPLYVNQISPSGIVTPLEVTSSGVKIESENPISVDGDSIIKLRFQIMALEWRLVAGLPEVTIDVLKLSTGELFIVTVSHPQISVPVADSPKEMKPCARGGSYHGVAPVSIERRVVLQYTDVMQVDVEKAPVVIAVPDIEPSSPKASESKDCGFLPLSFCEIKDKLLAAAADARHKVSQTRPCWAGRLPTHIRTHFGIDSSNSDSNQPGHPHGDYSERPSRHRYIHSFARGLIAVLIPILAGITVGLLVSFLGLLVGRTIGCLWIRFARGGRRGSASQASYGEEDFEEGKILMSDEDVDPLPVYESAPAYEELDSKAR